MDAMAILTGLVEDALARWPDLRYKNGGDRAQAAAEYVANGKVEFRGESPFTGDDHWVVNGHHCSLAGDCECRDSLAPHDERFGRLCKHRLAVMFQIKLDRERLAALEAALAGGGEIVLEVRTYYAYADNLDMQRTRLVGWRRCDGGLWQRPAEEIPFRVRDLARILYRCGLRVKPGGKLNVGRRFGGVERWWLEPMDAEDRQCRMEIATRIGSLYGRDAATAEDQARERRLAQMFKAGMEAAIA